MAQHDGHILMPPYVGMSHAMIVAVPSNWPVGLPGTIPENHHDNIRLPAAASSASFHRELYRRRRSFKGRAVMFFSHLRRGMWLFGMITIIDMALTRMIETAYPDGSWRQCLSEDRRQKAETLLEERQRRNQELDLPDCLQFSDRGQIVLRNEELREEIPMKIGAMNHPVRDPVAAIVHSVILSRSSRKRCSYGRVSYTNNALMRVLLAGRRIRTPCAACACDTRSRQQSKLSKARCHSDAGFFSLMGW